VVPGSLLFGSARQLRGDPLGTYRQAMLTHGSFARFRIGPPRVGFEFDAVFTPEGARQVLASDVASYRKDAPVFQEVARFLGDGLLTSEGDRWRRDRRIVQPLFTPRRVAAHVETVATTAAELVSSWRPEAEAARPVDLYDSAMRYALSALGRAVFGEDMAGAQPMLRVALPEVSVNAVRRGLAIVRLPRFLPTPSNRRAERAQRAMYRLVEELTARRRSAPAQGHDLLSLLLEARDPETGAGLDDAAVRDQALIFLLAGHETTASALAFTLQLVASDAVVQDRLRTEVAEFLGDRRPGHEDLEHLAYTAQVVQEALRIYPPGHTMVRKTVAETELLGHALPKGRIVAVSMWGIHHNPAVWPDPERFDPDRFAGAGADGAAPGPHQIRYAHLPFGGGPRACIGERLAMAELVIAVADVVRSYRLRALVDRPPLDVGLTLRPAGPLWCRLEPVG